MKLFHNKNKGWMIMNEQHVQESGNAKKSLCYKDGRFYFTKEAERSFYFICLSTLLKRGYIGNVPTGFPPARE